MRKMHKVPREQRNLVRGKNPTTRGCAVQPRVWAWRHRGWDPGRRILWEVKCISHPFVVSKQLRGKTSACSPVSSPFPAGRRAEAGTGGMLDPRIPASGTAGMQDWPWALQSVLSLSPRCSNESLKNRNSSFFCPLCRLCQAGCYYLQNPDMETPVLQELVLRVKEHVARGAVSRGPVLLSSRR